MNTLTRNAAILASGVAFIGGGIEAGVPIGNFYSKDADKQIVDASHCLRWIGPKQSIDASKLPGYCGAVKDILDQDTVLAAGQTSDVIQGVELSIFKIGLKQTIQDQKIHSAHDHEDGVNTGYALGAICWLGGLWLARKRLKTPKQEIAAAE